MVNQTNPVDADGCVGCGDVCADDRLPASDDWVVVNPLSTLTIELEVDTISKESELGDEYNKVDDVIPLSMTSSDIIGNRFESTLHCGLLWRYVLCMMDGIFLQIPL